MKIISILLLFLISLTACAGTGAIPSGPNIKMLKDNIRFKNTNTRIMSNDSDDPTVVAKDAAIGSIYIRSTTGVLYQKMDTGSSTNWQPLLIGPAGSGTDNHVVRWNGDGVPQLQDSVVDIDDLGVVTGITALSVDNLTLDGNTISSTDVDGNIILSPNGVGFVNIPNQTVSKPLQLDASNNVYSADINATLDITGLVPLEHGGTGADLSGVATDTILYKDSATTYGQLGGWTVNDRDGLESFQTVTPTDAGGLVFVSQNRSEVELDLSENSTLYNYTHQAIDTHFDRTGSGFDYSGQFTSLSSNTTIEGANNLGNLTGIDTAIAIGDGTDVATADSVIANRSSLSVNANSSVDEFIGRDVSINNNPTGVVGDVYGERISVNLTNDTDNIYLSNKSSTGDTTSDFISTSNSHEGDVGGSYTYNNGFHNNGVVTGNVTVFQHNHTGNVLGNYNGFNQNFTGDAASMIGNTTNLTGNATSMTGTSLFLNGDTTANKTGLNINLTGASDNATALNINVSSQTISNAANDLVSITTNGGIISTFSDATVKTGGAFQAMNSMVANANIISGSPRTVDLLGISTPMLLNFDDDMSVGGFGLGTAAAGYVSQINGSGTATVDQFSGAVAAVADLASTGGTITDAAGFRTIGPLSAGGSATITNFTAFKMNSGANLGTNRWGIKINDAAAENFFDKSLKIGGTEFVSNSDVGLEIGSLKAIKMPVLTEVQRDALTPLESMFVYNDDDDELNIYDGSAWVPVGSGNIAAWVTATDYEIGDVVYESNKIYRALTDHTSGVFATDLANNDWVELSDGIEPIGSSTDNAIVRFDGTTGDLVQDSSVLISDLDAITGVTALDVDNINIDGNTISSTDVNGNIILDPNGTGLIDIVGPIQLAQLTTPAAPAASSNLLYFKADSNVYKQDENGLEVRVGEKSKDIYHTETFEGSVNSAAFSCGNNATFLGGGTVDGTVSDETVAPISGLVSFEYIQGATSVNDYCASPVIALDSKQKDNETYVSFYYNYDGGDDDIEWVFYDVTNTNEMTQFTPLYVKTTTKDQRSFVAFRIPSTATTIRYGFKTLVSDSGSILRFDDIEFSTKPSAFGNVVDRQTIVYDQNESDLVSGTSTGFEFNLTNLSNSGYQLLNPVNTSSRTEFTAVKECYVSLDLSHEHNTNTTDYTIEYRPNGGAFARRAISGTSGTGGNNAIVTGHFKMAVGDTFYIDSNLNSGSPTVKVNLNLIANADSDSVVTPVKVSPNIFSVRVDNNGTASLVSTSTPFIESGDISRTALGKTTIDVSDLELTVAPAVTVSGLQGSGDDMSAFVQSISTTSIQVVTEFGSTGVEIDRPYSITITRQGSDVRDAEFLASIPVEKTAYLKDLKTSGTSAGTTTANTVQTRTLNTVEGDADIVTLSANQFTLHEGKYDIEAIAPHYESDRGQLFIYNVTDAVYVIDGTSDYLASSTAGQIKLSVKGRLNLTSTKIFELRHWSQGASATGLGFASDVHASNPQSNEVYAVVEITKKVSN